MGDECHNMDVAMYVYSVHISHAVMLKAFSYNFKICFLIVAIVKITCTNVLFCKSCYYNNEKRVKNQQCLIIGRYTLV